MAYTPAPGEIVPVSKSPGYIILSYVVSYVGCLTALELLVRRTHHGGHYNWFLLGGAATAMGGVAIWSMHYIGMQAMIMGNGEDALQLYYYASYTAGSFFLPIVVVSFAFSVFSSSRRASAWRIAIAGIFCGTAICGMHYVGQVGIVNYEDVWSWWYVFGSIAIALSAATIALAGAVCLMHWMAILGTTFKWKGLDTSLPPGLSKTGAVWVCGALAVSCCLVLFALAIIFQYLRRKYTQKAQQISLALAYFAPDGGIMLDNGGRLPLNKITKNYLRYSTKDNFDVDSVPFAWMYRVSRNWTCVDEILPSMRLHIHLEQETVDDYNSSIESAGTYSYLTVLKELYCVAADDLAHTVGLPLSKVGFLYDRILDTGRMTPHIKMFTQGAATVTTDSDVESGLNVPRTTLTRGQVLFLVRHLNLLEVTRLQTLGFSFVPPRTVASSISASMHITSEELRPCLDDLAVHKEMPQMLETGVHLAMFVVKPVIGGFEILANRTIRNQLPSLTLPLDKLEVWQLSLLTQYDNWEASSLLTYWTLESTRIALTDTQMEFVTSIVDTMIQLQIRVGNQVFDRARFIAKPLVDSGTNGKLEDANAATLLAFRYVTDIHYVHPVTSMDMFVNARLFTTQQHCYPGSSDHAVFAGRVHTEFAAIPGVNAGRSRPEVNKDLLLERHGTGLRQSLSFPQTLKRDHLAHVFNHLGREDDSNYPPKGTHNGNVDATYLENPYRPVGPVIAGTKQIHTNSENTNTSSVSTRYLDPQQTSGHKPRSFFAKGGGVHVSNEVRVTVADARTGSSEKIEMSRLGTKTEIGTVHERESIVDILMAMTLGGLRN